MKILSVIYYIYYYIYYIYIWKNISFWCLKHENDLFIIY